jgi:hypothetical protein
MAPRPDWRAQALSTLLAGLLIINGIHVPAVAQDSTIEIAVISGEGFEIASDFPRNDEIVVRLQDSGGRRIRGAAVFFEIPNGFATFVGGVSAVTVISDDDGVARARIAQRGLRTGQFEIAVSASYQGMRGSARIHQSNIARQAMSAPHKALIIGGVAAAIGGAAFGLSRGDRRTTATLGSGTVVPSR